MANKPIDLNARRALKNMKVEVSDELGLKNNNVGDKGNLTSRTNGSYGGNLGGTMTRKLIEIGERELMNKDK